jgi:hypothetical protein
MEFIDRMALAFGTGSVPRLRWPLMFARSHAESLTMSSELGITRTAMAEPRRHYHDASDDFHRRIAAGASPYVPFPLRERPFEAPELLLP